MMVDLQNPDVVEPQTLTAWKVVGMLGDGSWVSAIAKEGFTGGRQRDYALGKRTEFHGEPAGTAFRTFSDAHVFASREFRTRPTQRAILRVDVVESIEVPAWVRRLVPPPGTIYCSSITPLAVVREDGTEEGAEHRVSVVEVVDGPYDEHGNSKVRVNGERQGATVYPSTLIHWIGTWRPGRYEATTSVRRLPDPEPEPEPEPERVKPLRIQCLAYTIYECPKCKARFKVYAGDPFPEACSACGVLLEELHDG